MVKLKWEQGKTFKLLKDTHKFHFWVALSAQMIASYNPQEVNKKKLLSNLFTNHCYFNWRYVKTVYYYYSIFISINYYICMLFFAEVPEMYYTFLHKFDLE